MLGRMRPVLDYLAANDPRFLDQLCAYLRFPSVSAKWAWKMAIRSVSTSVASASG